MWYIAHEMKNKRYMLINSDTLEMVIYDREYILDFLKQRNKIYFGCDDVTDMSVFLNTETIDVYSDQFYQRLDACTDMEISRGSTRLLFESGIGGLRLRYSHDFRDSRYKEPYLSVVRDDLIVKGTGESTNIWFKGGHYLLYESLKRVSGLYLENGKCYIVLESTTVEVCSTKYSVILEYLGEYSKGVFARKVLM